jgi:leucyl/phenylalanyl-tRNA--protein transferase
MFDRWEELAATPASAHVPLALGGRLTAPLLLGAYRAGVFSFPTIDPTTRESNRERYGALAEGGQLPVHRTGDPYAITWWRPPVRPVIPIDQVYLESKARRRCRRDDLTTTVDTAFVSVLDACRQDRHPYWLIPEMVDALGELRRQGQAHSVEVWQGADLVGGAFGVGVGAVFTVDSAFHRTPFASKIAIADLARRLSATAAVMLDVQVMTDHVRGLGAREIDQHEFAQMLSSPCAGLLCPGPERASRLVNSDRLSDGA